MSAPQLVIFDCDGVLVDSESISARVSSQILTEHGWSIAPADLMARFKGCTDEHWRAAVAERIPAASLDEWHERQAARYDAAFNNELVAIDGVAEAIARIPVPICVASNGSHVKIERNLERVGLLDLFRGAIFSAQDVPRGKPAPDLFLHAAITMDVSPATVVVVEDSRHGVAAAAAAGMRCLMYSSESPGRDVVSPGTLVFESMDRLPALLGFATD